MFNLQMYWELLFVLVINNVCYVVIMVKQLTLYSCIDIGLLVATVILWCNACLYVFAVIKLLMNMWKNGKRWGRGTSGHRNNTSEYHQGCCWRNARYGDDPCTVRASERVVTLISWLLVLGVLTFSDDDGERIHDEIENRIRSDITKIKAVFVNF